MTDDLRDLLEANAKAQNYMDNCMYKDFMRAARAADDAARALSEFYWSELYDGPEEG